MQLTARQAYIDILTELVKRSTYLRITFIILIKRSVSIWCLETNQQLADDMRSWKKSFQASSLETPSAVYTKVYRAQQ
jgi:hypothetical protein